MLSQESKKNEWLSKKRQLQQRSSWWVFATPSWFNPHGHLLWLPGAAPQPPAGL